MARHAVVIAGGGPTGLMLAAELALGQVDVVIVERRATPDPDRARAGGLHARTIDVLDQRGVADRFLQEGPCRTSATRSSPPTGRIYGVHSLTWTSRFTENTRQAASYRQGRILLAAMRRTCMPRSVVKV